MKKKLIALAMLFALALTMVGCGKSAAVKETERLINGIGTVTEDSEAVVEAAEAAYAALSEKEQKTVENVETLTAARQTLDAALQDALVRTLAGAWEVELDAREDLVAELDAQFSGVDKSFGDYLDSYTIRMTLELKTDGTYHMIADSASVEESFDGLRSATKSFLGDFLVKYIADYLESSGIKGDFSTKEGLEAAIGKDLDTAIQDTLGMTLDEYVDQMMGELSVEQTVNGTEMEGKFKAASDKLWFSGSAEEEINEDNYVVYTLENDTMTWTEQVGDGPMNFDGALVFTRVG